MKLYHGRRIGGQEGSGTAKKVGKKKNNLSKNYSHRVGLKN